MTPRTATSRGAGATKARSHRPAGAKHSPCRTPARMASSTPRAVACFPGTALVTSVPADAQPAPRLAAHARRADLRAADPDADDALPGGADAGALGADVRRRQQRRGRRGCHPRSDRKSTRLNSSHLGISYAVFGV